MRVPANLIQESKYTTGGEFVFKNTNTPYKGYYYNLNNSYFIGKTFDPNAEEIIKIQNSNILLSNLSTFIYSTITGITSQQLSPKKIQSIIPTSLDRYFVKYNNIIKEVSKDTYTLVLNDPTYQTAYIDNTHPIDQADKQMPGLKTFLTG
jgi:c-di-AMP phosphodiesterase-like protein